MKKERKIISIALSAEQFNYLENLSSGSKKPSTVLREILQKHIEQEDNKKVGLEVKYAVKTFHLLRQFLHDYHNKSERTIETAETIANEVLVNI